MENGNHRSIQGQADQDWLEAEAKVCPQQMRMVWQQWQCNDTPHHWLAASLLGGGLVNDGNMGRISNAVVTCGFC